MSTTIEALANRQAEGLLADVVGRLAAVLIEVQDGENWLGCPSRFLGRPDGQVGRLWLARPDERAGESQSQPAPTLNVGVKLVVNFTWQQQRYRFAATVVQTGRAKFAGRPAADGILITSPTSIQRLQRRANYRCTIPTTQRIEATLWEGGQRYRDLAQAGGEPIRCGRMLNLSVSGMGLKLYGRLDPRLRLGQRVGLEFLVSESTPLLLDALVRRITTTADGAFEFGLEFAAVDGPPQGQPIRVTELLAKRIAEMQRLSLQRNRAG